MTDVFISYRKTDDRKAYANRIAFALRSLGVDVYWDDQLTGGQAFEQEIFGKIDTAKVVLVLWCAESVNSEWVVREARHAGDKLFPVRLQAVSPPQEFAHLHALDLNRWRGDVSEPKFEALVVQLGKRLGRALNSASDAKRELRQLPKLPKLKGWTNQHRANPRVRFAEAIRALPRFIAWSVIGGILSTSLFGASAVVWTWYLDPNRPPASVNNFEDWGPVFRNREGAEGRRNEALYEATFEHVARRMQLLADRSDREPTASIGFRDPNESRFGHSQHNWLRLLHGAEPNADGSATPFEIAVNATASFNVTWSLASVRFTRFCTLGPTGEQERAGLEASDFAARTIRPRSTTYIFESQAQNARCFASMAEDLPVSGDHNPPPDPYLVFRPTVALSGAGIERFNCDVSASSAFVGAEFWGANADRLQAATPTGPWTPSLRFSLYVDFDAAKWALSPISASGPMDSDSDGELWREIDYASGTDICLGSRLGLSGRDPERANGISYECRHRLNTRTGEYRRITTAQCLTAAQVLEGRLDPPSRLPQALSREPTTGFGSNWVLLRSSPVETEFSHWDQGEGILAIGACQRAGGSQ